MTVRNPRADCISSEEAQCNDNVFDAGAEAGIAAGRLQYDALAARAFVARFEVRPPDCRGFYDVGGLTYGTLQTLRGTFVGTLLEGDA